jgi:hypothetical protein
MTMMGMMMMMMMMMMMTVMIRTHDIRSVIVILQSTYNTNS